jgi:uncharacterized membrane protein (DUF4010 family)
MDAAEIMTAFGIAAVLGALIGLERQVRRGTDEGPYAGLRTFALYALWGAGAGFLGEQYGAGAFAVAAAGFAGLVLVEYWTGSVRRGDPGTTTEAAAFATFVIGALVWAGYETAALALAVGVAILLQSKGWIHRVVSRFEAADLRAILRFGVLTAIVLPLVPNRDMGPFDALNPFEIWLMVVFVSAIGLVGYAALRILGPSGLAPTGLLGGLISSTAVTLGFSRMSRTHRALSRALTAGVLAASGLMYARVLVEAVVIEPELAGRLAPVLVVLFVAVEGAAAWWWLRAGTDGEAEPKLELKNPVTIPLALQFGLVYGAVVFVAGALLDQFSAESLNVVGALSGINDVDAITLATADLVRDEAVTAGDGAEAVLAAVVVNTAVKGALAATLGGKALAWRVGLVLGAAAVAAGVAWVVV